MSEGKTPSNSTTGQPSADASASAADNGDGSHSVPASAEDHAPAPPGPNAAQETDLVIREGFPAFYEPGGKKPLLDVTESSPEPVPRHAFWAEDDVVRFSHDDTDETARLLALQSLQRDCEIVFTARDKVDGQAYSAGQTFFLPADMAPRCALEHLVMTIFNKHVDHVDPTMYNRHQSGAEWWTLVLDHHGTTDADERGSRLAGVEQPDNNNNGDGDGDGEADGDEEQEEDEVGLHFDADYELEEQAPDLLLHPRLATVTYLSNVGAPTLVIDKRSPPPNDVRKNTLERPINRAWLSHPKVGKHLAFDGRLLHGAPALFFPSKQRRPAQDTSATGTENNDPQSKRQKLEPQKRITLLVNIWINHWVMDAAVLDDDVCKKLTTKYETPASTARANLKGDDTYAVPFRWSESIDMSKPTTNLQKVTLGPSDVDPGGEDEIALCNHTVTVKYNPLMEELHMASYSGDTVEMELKEKALQLVVGNELPDASEDESNSAS